MEAIATTRGAGGCTRRQVLGGAMALAACGRAPDPARLSLWAMDVEGENSAPLLPAFTRASGVPVDLQWLAWTAAHEKLLTAFAGGSLPDVTMLARDWVAEFAAIGAVAPIPAAAGLLGDAYAPHALAVGGTDYAVPWTLDASVQYYRRDLLARAGYPAPPARLDEWRAMLRAVKRVQGDRYAVLMQLNWPDHLLQLAAEFVASPLRDRDARGDFRSAGFREALGLYVSLFREGLAPLVGSVEAADPAGDLARGWIALYPAGAWNRAELLRRQGSLPRARWAAAPMPGRGGPARAMVAGAVLCVSRTAADPARAWALVRHLTAPPTELRLHQIAGTLPSRPSAWAAPAIAADPVMQVFRTALAHPAPMPAALEWSRIAAEMQLVAEQAARGLVSVPAAAAEMDRRADAILAKRRWLLDRGRL